MQGYLAEKWQNTPNIQMLVLSSWEWWSQRDCIYSPPPLSFPCVHRFFYSSLRKIIPLVYYKKKKSKEKEVGTMMQRTQPARHVVPTQIPEIPYRNVMIPKQQEEHQLRWEGLKLVRQLPYVPQSVICTLDIPVMLEGFTPSGAITQYNTLRKWLVSFPYLWPVATNRKKGLAQDDSPPCTVAVGFTVMGEGDSC